LRFCNFTISDFYDFTILPFYNFTISDFYDFTIFPFYTFAILNSEILPRSRNHSVLDALRQVGAISATRILWESFT